MKKNLDEIMQEAGERVARTFAEARFRTRCMLIEQGATLAEIDSTLEWQEECCTDALGEALEKIRAQLIATRLH